MRARRLIPMLAGLMAIAIGPVAIQAQAFAAGEDGKLQQEKQAPLIPSDQQPTQEQLLKLFDAMRIKQQLQSMRQLVPSMVQQQIKSAVQQTEENLPAGRKLTPSQRTAIENIMAKYVGKAMDLYPADEMFADMTAIYQRHLSKDDVDGMIAFYSSPAGQHLLDAQPVIAQEFMPVVLSKVTARSQVMTKEMMKEIGEVVPSARQGSGKVAPKQGVGKPAS
jgi:uncharacterized protein